VLTGKLADADEAATFTDAGAIKAIELLDNAIAAPVFGAALLSVMTQLLEAFGPRLPGVQESDDTREEDTRPIFVLAELLPTVAVRVDP
jgi:hypothetical protein